MVYEGMGTTWDHQESSLAKLTFGRHPPGELRSAFAGLEVLRDDVEAIDDGRELSFFAARRPA